MGHRLGCHWQREHQDNPLNFGHMAKMKYLSYTLFKKEWTDATFCRDLLAVAEPQAIFLLRDHALSEEKDACVSDPAGTGVAHAIQFGKKWEAGEIHLPRERFYALGINELDTNQFERQLDIYETNRARQLATYGIRSGGYSLGVGHPSTINHKPENDPDWSWYRDSAETLIRLGGIACIHEYWLPGNYAWGDWAGRFISYCPYDLKFVVKEGFYDSGLVPDLPNKGYKHYVELGDPVSVNHALSEINGYMSRNSKDPRFHSFQCFTYDHANPWDSFDIRDIAKYFETYPWQMADEQEINRLPIVIGGKPGAIVQKEGNLALPFTIAAPVTQRFGENPADYARFGLPGHNGTDYGLPQGSQVLAIADGEVQWVGEDEDYGNYVRLFHRQLGFHSFYGHLATMSVRAGEQVKRGRIIATSGTTGNSTGPHLHLEIRLANADGSYKEGSFGYGKGRVDPETVYAILNYEV